MKDILYFCSGTEWSKDVFLFSIFGKKIEKSI